MLYISFVIFFLESASLERALDSYVLNVGDPPSWMTEEQQKAAIMDRWYVDIETAKCKPFKYLGSLGNFNNFVSKAVCENHLKFTPEEKSKACDTKVSVGSCKVSEENKFERWYYSKSPVGGSQKNSCHKFDYTGCGGNANNFDSKSECENACKNNVNGVVEGNPTAYELVKVPNEFDCLFSAEVDTKDPKMGIVLHKNKKQCVYGAVGENANRGFFNDLPTCVEKCIPKPVAACVANGPFQIELESVVTEEDGSIFKEFYYFNPTRKACLPFVSKDLGDTLKIDDGEKNIFSSVEICASFCPATAHIGDINAEEPCKQPNIGVSANDDKYKLKRYYYDNTDVNHKECKEFSFNGKEMNLNNFKTIGGCEAICKTPLSTVAVATQEITPSQPTVTTAADKEASTVPSAQRASVSSNGDIKVEAGSSSSTINPVQSQGASNDRSEETLNNCGWLQLLCTY